MSQDFIQYIPIPAFLYDNDKEIIFSANRKFCKLFGKKCGDVSYKLTDYFFDGPLQEGEHENVLIHLDEKRTVKGFVNVSELPSEGKIFHLYVIQPYSSKHISKEEIEKVFNDLNASEAKYRVMIESSGDSIFIIQNGRIQYVNPELIRLSEYAEQELLGSDFLDFIAPSEKEKVASFFYQRSTDANAPSKYESAAVTKSGKIMSVEVLVMKINYNGMNAWQVVLRDITGRKAIENQLRQSEARYRALFQDSASVMLMINPENGAIVDANQSACNFYGYAYDDITCKNISEINCLPTEKAYSELIKANQKEKRQFNFKHRLANGEVRDVEVLSGPVVVGGGRVVYSIVYDVTGRIEAQQNLDDTNLMLTTILDNMPGGYLLIGENYIIEQVNDRTCEVTGFSREELVGQLCDILCPKGSLSKKCPVWEEGQMSFSGMDTTVKCKDGRRNPVLKNAQVITIKGKRYILESFQDITSVKQAEKDLILAKEKAEESDRLKSAFLANMSHEIRTPMNGIIGFTTLMEDPQYSAEEKRSFLSTIKDSGARLLDTVNDLIDISKIEAGQVNVHYSEIDVNGFMKKQYRFFEDEAQKRGLSLEYASAENPDNIIIRCDEIKLNSIFSNLIKNALKFTDTGYVRFGYRCENCDNKQILFFVEDSGIGIPKERQKAVFNRFEQADIEDKKAKQGSGLGLAITKAYVEYLNGTINLKSGEGKGSVFEITLPCNNDCQRERNMNVRVKDDMIKKESHQYGTALIADDEEYAVEYLTYLLEQKGFRVLVAENGEEAVKAMKNNEDIQLILMDIKMPFLNGYEATEQIRLFNKNVKIIAQTAFALSGDKEKALIAGCDAYISKPVKRNDLMEIIDELFYE